MRKEILPIAAMAGIIVLAQLVALLLAPAFLYTTGPVFQNPQDPVNSLLYIVLILGFTGIILLVIRIRRANVMKYVILGAMFFTMLLVFYLPFFLLFASWDASGVSPLPDAFAQNRKNGR